MIALLAIDTATDACSLALQYDGQRRVSHQVIPRQHQQQLFQLLHELFAGQAPAALGLSAIAYGRGPGSFTGLRIAASAAQGLAYSLQVPVVGISTLETQARTLLRLGAFQEPCIIASSIDARIGEIYSAWYHFDGETLNPLGEAAVARPDQLQRPSGRDSLPLLCAGSGFVHREALAALGVTAGQCWPDLLPQAQDMLQPAEALVACGAVGPAQSAIPDYVQPRIGWKTLAEQGKAS